MGARGYGATHASTHAARVIAAQPRAVSTMVYALPRKSRAHSDQLAHSPPDTSRSVNDLKKVLDASTQPHRFGHADHGVSSSTPHRARPAAFSQTVRLTPMTPRRSLRPYSEQSGQPWSNTSRQSASAQSHRVPAMSILEDDVPTASFARDFVEAPSLSRAPFVPQRRPADHPSHLAQRPASPASSTDDPLLLHDPTLTNMSMRAAQGDASLLAMVRRFEQEDMGLTEPVSMTPKRPLSSRRDISTPLRRTPKPAPKLTPKPTPKATPSLYDRTLGVKERIALIRSPDKSMSHVEQQQVHSPEPDLDLQPELESELEPESKVAAEPEPELEPELEWVPEPEREPQMEPERPETEREPELEPVMHSELDLEPEPEPEPEPELEPGPEPELEPDLEPAEEPESEPEAVLEPKTHASPSLTGLNTKNEALAAPPTHAMPAYDPSISDQVNSSRFSRESHASREPVFIDFLHANDEHVNVSSQEPVDHDTSWFERPSQSEPQSYTPPSRHTPIPEWRASPSVEASTRKQLRQNLGTPSEKSVRQEASVLPALSHEPKRWGDDPEDVDDLPDEALEALDILEEELRRKSPDPVPQSPLPNDVSVHSARIRSLSPSKSPHPAMRVSAQDVSSDDTPEEEAPMVVWSLPLQAPAAPSTAAEEDASLGDLSASLSASSHSRALMLSRTRPTSCVEISSLDPVAAARAAAILKVHHKYIQEGWLGDTSSLPHINNDLASLFHAAELDLRQSTHPTPRVPGAYAPRASLPPQLDSHALRPQAQAGHWSEFAWMELDRHLRSYVPEEAMDKAAAVLDLDIDQVILQFLEAQGLEPDDLHGDWTLTRLYARVPALQARYVREMEQDVTEEMQEKSFQLLSQRKRTHDVLLDSPQYVRGSHSTPVVPPSPAKAGKNVAPESSVLSQSNHSFVPTDDVMIEAGHAPKRMRTHAPRPSSVMSKLWSWVSGSPSSQQQPLPSAAARHHRPPASRLPRPRRRQARRSAALRPSVVTSATHDGPRADWLQNENEDEAMSASLHA